MKYKFTFPNPSNHLIQIYIPHKGDGSPTEFWLPLWRPGRYEMGPYAENIVDVYAVTDSGKPLKVTKSTTHQWKVEATDEFFEFRYSYYATDWGAGGSRFDADLIYVNGINLLMYRPGTLDEPCQIELHLPDGYEIACGLPREGNVLKAEDFHQAVDGPWVASDQLQLRIFEVAGTPHHVWFMGAIRPDWPRIERDFAQFGRSSVELFGDFPVSEYHYLILTPNTPNYHGVEHYNSTVISLGPAYKIMGTDYYNELLGVSCHELFHTWNVKAIRPADMQPYDYERENYSKLHYVTEGVTTYYGDLMLMKSGVWSLSDYLSNFNNAILKRHYNNQGRNHVSLEQASFDSWLTGYKSAVPNRKISFYTKGCLAALILDYLIRSSSGNRRSLDNVMREMWERFGKTGRGYTRTDYREIAEKYAGVSLGRYFKAIVSGTKALEPYLRDVAGYFGLKFAKRQFTQEIERWFGLGLKKGENGFPEVRLVYEGSPAERAGMEVGDELVALNGLRVVEKDFSTLFNHFEPYATKQLHVFRQGSLVEVTLQFDPDYQTELYMLGELDQPSAVQLENRRSWMSVEVD